MISLCLRSILIIQEDSFTIKLLFNTKGPGRIDDPYFLQYMYNRCVVCGSENRLTRHHIVPFCYKKFFDDNIKSHCHYDVMLLCINCHEKYEHQSIKLKKEIAEKYKIPFEGKGIKTDIRMAKAKKAAFAIINYKEKLPKNRLEELLNIIKDYLQKEYIEDFDLNEISKLDPLNMDEYISQGEMVVEKLKDLKELEEFIKMWRKHFILKMNPQFLPDYWEADRGIQKT